MTTRAEHRPGLRIALAARLFLSFMPGEARPIRACAISDKDSRFKALVERRYSAMVAIPEVDFVDEIVV